MLNKSTNTTISHDLAEKLKQARKHKGLTQGQLAKKIGAELIDQFIQIDTLPENDRHMLKALLEAFVKKHRFEELAMK
ncbi:MAG: hypothetical protein R6U40_10410 [Desulfobacterales bacterium]